MDFLELVQKKEHKTDNKIIGATVILVVFIMSAIIFWPSKPKHHLLTYLPNDVSFYLYWTSKDDLLELIFTRDVAEERVDDLENILGANFLNLQEVLWFQIDNDSGNDNYLLRFSRLPKSVLLNLENRNLDFKVSSPDKNILLINKGKMIDNIEFNKEREVFFDKGVSIYWQKNKAPEFLSGLAEFLEPSFVTNDILLNWQRIANGKNRLSLLEKRSSKIKDIKYFLVPKEFDIAFSFNNILSNVIAENISNSLLKTFFNSLPYYNLDTRVIKDRLLKDTILFQKGDAWILASNKDWQDNILDFLNSLNIQEVSEVLSDGTAYTELIVSDKQSIIEHEINGQKVLQIDTLFIWDIGDKHYLTNKRWLIEEITSHNHYIASIIGNCLGDIDARVGDLIYFNDRDIPEGQIKDYLVNNNITSLKAFSYATGTISGLNICF